MFLLDRSIEQVRHLLLPQTLTAPKSGIPPGPPAQALR